MKKLYGVTAAMVTPFKISGEVDYDGLGQLTCMLIDKGVDCLYPCGTTGEMFRVSVEERKKIAETVIQKAMGRVRVFVHCGAMDEKDTIQLLRHAESAGADGAGIVTPAFFGATDRELEEYYVRAAGSVGSSFPVYLYNIPQCSGNDITKETAERIISRCENIVGIKYSFADINRTIDYLNLENGSFSVLHGCDRAFASMLALGCDGTVSGIAGVFPEPFVEVYKAYMEGRLEDAQRLQKICVKYCDALKCGSNMSYFKEGLKMRGISGGVMRKPQLDIDEEEIQRLRKELEDISSGAGIKMEAEVRA